VSERPNESGTQSSEQQRLLVEAMAHPIRAKLLFAVADKSEEGVSVRQLSERIGEPQRRVRYHLDALQDMGLVGIASRRSRGGVVERFYRSEQALMLTTEQLAEWDEDHARRISAQILKTILVDASGALGANVFGMRAGHSLLRVPGEVDEQGWDELGKIQERALDEVQAVLAASRDRLSASGESPIPTLTALLLFEVPRWPAP
jgi:DNA-binding transcriptional ArsR family regulator